MAKLVVLEGANVGESYPLEGEASVGRSSDNTICLSSDGCASRKHARFFEHRGSCFVEDLGSANGTFVRGRLIMPSQPCQIYDGDEILAGATRIRFVGVRHPDTSLQGMNTQDFGGLSVIMPPSDQVSPSAGHAVDVSLDAQRSMIALDERESVSALGQQQAIKRLQAICQVSSALGSITNQRALMQRIMDCIFDIFPTADRAFILLKDRSGDELSPIAARKRVETPGILEEVAISRTIINDVMSNKRSILSRDAQSDDRFRNQMSVMNFSIRSMMCSPLLVSDEILGIIQVDSANGVKSFNEQDLLILTGISAQAAIAVKNALLYRAVEEETMRRSSLQRYFSPRMVEMMMGGEVNTSLGGKRYKGTVFFSDIIGFTRMSEAMTPEGVVANLNRYFTIMQKVLYENGGNVDKFGGDAIMAFWSVPQHSDGDELKATLTGVQMHAGQWLFNLELLAEGQDPIHMGIGINSGVFVAGNIGSEDKIEFTLIGDDVNLAARIESLAGRWQTFISASTYDAVADDVGAIQLPPVSVKGKKEPITIYSIRLVRLSECECALSIPCDVLDSIGEICGSGFLAESRNLDSGPQLTFYTLHQMAVGRMLTLRMDLPEYHDAITFSACPVSCTPEMQDGVRYYRLILDQIAGDGALRVLSPGVCLQTQQDWGHIQRGI